MGAIAGEYGSFDVDKKTVRAHRYVYQAFRGPIPDGLVLDHTCRLKCCVNPWHLDPVTNMENLQRSPLYMSNRTHCSKGHEYSGDNLFRRSNGWRGCKACIREASIKYEREHRIERNKPRKRKVV